MPSSSSVAGGLRHVFGGLVTTLTYRTPLSVRSATVTSGYPSFPFAASLFSEHLVLRKSQAVTRAWIATQKLQGPETLILILRRRRGRSLPRDKTHVILKEEEEKKGGRRRAWISCFLSPEKSSSRRSFTIEGYRQTPTPRRQSRQISCLALVLLWPTLLEGISCREISIWKFRWCGNPYGSTSRTGGEREKREKVWNIRETQKQERGKKESSFNTHLVLGEEKKNERVRERGGGNLFYTVITVWPSWISFKRERSEEERRERREREKWFEKTTKEQSFRGKNETKKMLSLLLVSFSGIATPRCIFV